MSNPVAAYPTKAEAKKHVNRHVVPKGCFITTDNGRDWRPLDGTGCAHWVAHQLGIRRGKRGSSACDLGFALRVKDVVQGRRKVPVAEVQPDDIWAAKDLKHCGLVVGVTPPTAKGGMPKIDVKHDSSAQGGVKVNEWAKYFHGKGDFYR